MDSQVTTRTALLTPPPSGEPLPPVWMQRFFLVSTVIFCLWVGLVLCVLPWLPAWTENGLVNDFPGLRWFLGTGIGCKGSRLIAVPANGGTAFGSYRVDPNGGHTPFAIQLIELSGDRIVGHHNFLDPKLFPLFGLPTHLPE